MPAPARPLLIAHRGASADAPENTIAAFELALDQGADGLELDIHLSADGHPVVIHDFTLERTTDGAGPVSALSVRELKRLDAGGWCDHRFQGQRVQTLQEILERFRDRARFWLELKGGPALYPGLEERVVSTVEIYDVVDRVLVQSFDPAAVGEVRALNRAIRVGIVTAKAPLDRTLLRPGAVDAICPALDMCSEGLIGDVRAAGLDCYVWTVNEPAQVDRLVGWGVSGIITDRPGTTRARLDR
ncbi:MAG TPA: glycerophosphodiester phosphodiesterase family protein [Verrucomicrobiae bacterium]|jgi:glycerophosphoryl diester phosphodiesterase|nr:glycerophosphodiester phosphodiesterase family protein [Verrucomicrobiae bacterium]